MCIRIYVYINFLLKKINYIKFAITLTSDVNGHIYKYKKFEHHIHHSNKYVRVYATLLAYINIINHDDSLCQSIIHYVYSLNRIC